MKKIIVIGCPGSGKTTFSKSLAEISGFPLYHLDSIWHKADRTHISREEFDLRLGEILSRDQYIIDGNYPRTLERRIAACDTVILFDLDTDVCLAGAVSRLGKSRDDMPWIDTELDPALEREILNFGEENLPTVYSLIEKLGEGKEIVIFKSREESQTFLKKFGK